MRQSHYAKHRAISDSDELRTRYYAWIGRTDTPTREALRQIGAINGRNRIPNWARDGLIPDHWRTKMELQLREASICQQHTHR
jgi:hypothetical protein